MFQASVDELGTALAAVAVDVPDGITVRGVCTDSRAILPGSLFVPLRGERFDGHDYLALALAAGAALVLADRPVSVPHLRVADTLAAYQALGRWWRRQFAIPVVAITGSAGKTTTRELVRAVLATAGPVLAPPANENNDVGVPKLLLQLEAHHRFCVVEMGMRGPGEIDRLARCAEPTVGVITNVGSAHIGRLGSFEAIAEAKCELVAGLAPGGLAVLNGEDERLLTTATSCCQSRMLTYGLVAGAFRGHYDGSHLRVEGIDFVPPLPGRHNLLNFLAALAVAHGLGLALADVRDRLGSIDLPAGRSRLLALGGDIELIDETYNSAPESAMATLSSLVERPGRRYIAVLGQMRELGNFSQDLHRQLGEHCRKLGLDHIVILEAGEDSEALRLGAADLPTVVLPDREAIVEYLLGAVQPGDRILFKASRAVGLEAALREFQRRFPTAACESAQ